VIGKFQIDRPNFGWSGCEWARAWGGVTEGGVEGWSAPHFEGFPALSTRACSVGMGTAHVGSAALSRSSSRGNAGG
jgi:hypothetical protein